MAWLVLFLVVAILWYALWRRDIDDSTPPKPLNTEVFPVNSQED